MRTALMLVLAGGAGGAASHGLGEATAPPQPPGDYVSSLAGLQASVDALGHRVDASVEELGAQVDALAQRVEPLEDAAYRAELREQIEAEVRREYGLDQPSGAP